VSQRSSSLRVLTLRSATSICHCLTGDEALSAGADTAAATAAAAAAAAAAADDDDDDDGAVDVFDEDDIDTLAAATRAVSCMCAGG